MWIEWQISRTYSTSSLDFEHPVYQQIIELGEAVVPFLLDGLEKETGDWFYALRIITGVNPVPLQLRYEPKILLMTDIWLNWGRSNGYIW